MNMTLQEWEKYRIYKRRDDFLGNPFITECDADVLQIDKFLKVIENYINMDLLRQNGEI